MTETEVCGQVYDEMISLEHPISRKHPQMPLMNRAAQFAPFAALTGYEDAVSETARLTDERIELDEYCQAELNEKLQQLRQQVLEGRSPKITITYFEPDDRKDGGVYRTLTGNVAKLDTYRQSILLEQEEREIFMQDILTLTVKALLVTR